jgi:hypothetical protein
VTTDDETGVVEASHRVAELIAKQEITDVLYRRVRASDRRDIDLALTCYHEGATEEHEGYSGTAAGFLTTQSMSAPGTTQRVTTLWHSLTNILIDLDRDNAAVESTYLGVVVRMEDGGAMHCEIGGRYLDKFAYRDSRWAITNRTVVYDWSTVALAGQSYLELVDHDESKIIKGRFGADDPLYSVLDISRG